MDIQIWQQKSPLHKGTGPGVQVERAAPETTQATAQCKSYKNHLPANFQSPPTKSMDTYYSLSESAGICYSIDRADLPKVAIRCSHQLNSCSPPDLTALSQVERTFADYNLSSPSDDKRVLLTLNKSELHGVKIYHRWNISQLITKYDLVAPPLTNAVTDSRRKRLPGQVCIGQLINQ